MCNQYIYMLFCFQPLVECFTKVKENSFGVQLRLSESWYREYQVCWLFQPSSSCIGFSIHDYAWSSEGNHLDTHGNMKVITWWHMKMITSEGNCLMTHENLKVITWLHMKMITSEGNCQITHGNMKVITWWHMKMITSQGNCQITHENLKVITWKREPGKDEALSSHPWRDESRPFSIKQ